MSELSELLGQRIVEAARMAVEMHLAMLADEDRASGDWNDGHERNTIAGGAGASVSTDGEPLALEDARDGRSHPAGREAA